jgi:hypothetical protein
MISDHQDQMTLSGSNDNMDISTHVTLSIWTYQHMLI